MEFHLPMFDFQEESSFRYDLKSCSSFSLFGLSGSSGLTSAVIILLMSIMDSTEMILAPLAISS